MRKFYLFIFIVLGFISNGSGQTLTVNPTSLDFGSICVNTTSASQSFAITGNSLTSTNITVGPLSGFTFSTTSVGPYTNSLSLSQGGGTYNQVIYVIFSPVLAQSYNGSIPISGGGASATNVNVTGTGLASQPVSVSIASDAAGNTICAGTSVTFTATPTNGGNSPTYQWQLNAVNIPGQTNPTFTTSTLANNDVVTVVIASNATCATGNPATSGQIKMVVNPLPTANAGGALSPICQNGTSAAMGGSVGGGATGGTWSGGAGTWTNPTDPANATYKASATESGTITLTLTTSGGSCGTTTVNKQITVNPNPTANAGGALSPICQNGTSAAMGGSVGGGATGGTWSGGAGTWTNPTDPANATYKASATESGTITLTLTTSGGSCLTTTATKQITVNPNPTANAGGALSPICQNGTSAAMGGSVGGGATGGTWSGGAGTWTNANDPANATYKAGASESGTITLTLTTSGGSCGTTTATKQITVNPNPTANAGGALLAICQGATSAAMGGSVGGGATGGTWSGGAGTWTNANDPANATYKAGASESGVITLTLTTSGGSCGTTTATKQITVNPNPTANAGGALLAICQGATSAAMGGSVGGGATGGTWSGGAGTWTNASDPANATYKAGASESGTITLTLTTSGGSCGTIPVNKQITVNPTLVPSVSISTPSTIICSGTSVTFTATPTNGGTTPSYQWKLNGANVGTNSQTYTSAGLTNGQTVTCVLTSNATCASPTTATSNSVTMSVFTGNPTGWNGSTSITVSPSASICPPATITLSVPAASNVQAYSWTLPTGWSIISGGSTNTVTVSVSSSAAIGVQIITVNAFNPCGSISVQSAANGAKAIKVNSFNGVVASPTSASVCSNGTLLLTGNLTGASTTGNWATTNGSISGQSQTGSTVTATYTPNISNGSATATITTNAPTGTCPNTPATATVTITVNQAVAITTQPTASQTLCSGSNATFTVAASGTGLTYQWYKGASIIAGATSATYTINNVATTDAGTYSVIVSGTAPCSSVTSTNSVLNVNQAVSITTQPTASQTLCSGSNATFTVAASGTGLTYQWYKGASIIAGATSATYTINNVATSDAGTYSVIVSGTAPCSSTTSTNSVLNVNQAVSITTQPTASQTLCSGSNATFTVAATGTGLTYQWYKGASSIAGATSATYTINNIATLDAGTYSVIVSGTAPCSSVTSNNAVLNVNQAVSITTQPAPTQTLCSGSNAIFTVSATGTGLTYQWYKGASSIAGATSATYTINNISTTDAGTYSVIVSGTAPCSSVTSNNSVLNVNQAVSITTQPTASQTLCSGGNATFSVTATGDGLTYQWYKGASSIAGATSATYTINNIATSDAGTYSVIVSGTAPCSSVTSNNAVLTVNQPVSITSQPAASQTVCLSFPVSFSVSATGTGITYQWMLNGNPIAGATSSTYSIAQAQQSDAGTYTVVVSGAAPCASVTSSNALLTVNQTITFNFQPTPQTVCVGSNASFTVTTTGTVNSYAWRKNGIPLSDGGSISGSTTATLTITGAALTDAGNYDVVVSGPAGACSQVISNKATLTVTPTVTIAAYSPATATRCQGAGTVTYSTTATNSTGITYSLDAASITGGNSINSSTGAVTYAAGWTGSSTITASAAGCNGLATTSIVVTTTPTVTISAFSPATATRCQGAATITTSTNATNNSSAIVYSLDATTAGFAGNSINSSTGAVTYAAGWSGTTTITASASGCNGPATTTLVVTTTPTVTIAAYSPATATRCQGAGTVTYSTTATNSTGITYSLDAASITGGNSINSSTGAVTYVAGWSGSSTITASAAGCNGPATTSIVVTTTPTVTIAVYSPATATRCQGAGTVTYSTTATNSTGITYSLDAASITGGNSINSSTGAVTYAAGWTGSSTITASAAGCNGPATTSIVVTTTPTVTISAFSPATSTRCQGAATITTSTSATNNSSAIVYSLDATTAGFAGNSINSSTGAVTYAAGWSGTTTITASAAGCNGPATTTLVVTTTPTVIIAAYSPATATRCQGAGTVTYSTTATNSTGITYSLDAASITAGNSINSSTGAVTYAAGWSGTSTITASAAGCNGPATTSIVVTTSPASVGGSLTIHGVSPSTNITSVCPSPNSVQIDLSSATGTVSWQQSTNGGGTWVAAVGTATPTTLTVTNLTQTTIYRAVVQSGPCAVAYSSIAVVGVIPANPPTNVVATPATVCLGQSSVLTADTGYPPIGIPSGSGGFNNGASDNKVWTVYVYNSGSWGIDGNSLNAGRDNSKPGDWGETNGPITVQSGNITYNNAPGGGKFAIASGAFNTILESPIFSLIGVSTATFNFSQAYTFSSGAIGKIEISTDGGSNYTTLPSQTFTGPASYGTISSGVTYLQSYSLDLSNYIGLSNLRIRFNYSGNATSSWALDNLSTPGAALPISYAWAGSTITAPGNTDPVTATTTVRGPNTYTITTTIGGCPGGSANVIVIALAPAAFPAGTAPVTSPICVHDKAILTGTPTGDNLVYTWQRSIDNGATWNAVSTSPPSPYSISSAGLSINNDAGNFSTLTISTDTSMVDDLYQLSVSNSVCGPSTATVPLQLNYVWKGRTSADWSDPSNWYTNKVPDMGCDSVYILSRPYPFEPTINAGYEAPTIKNLNVYNKATVTLLGELNIADHISHWGTGTIIARNGTLNLNGSSDQSIDANTFTNNDLFNLNLDNNASRRITNLGQLNIYGTLSFGLPILPFGTPTSNVPYNGGGNKNFITSDLVTIKSIASGTANVADLTNGGGTNIGNTITGQATVERYLNVGTGPGQHLKSWEFMATPTIGQTVFQSWMENGSKVSTGYGAQIYSPFGPGAGFDLTSPYPSMKYYTPGATLYPGAPDWTGITNTSIPIYNPNGYMLFVYGDRSVGPSTPRNTTTLRTKGTLITYTKTVPTSVGFTSIGNPYASAIDMRNVTKAGVDEFYYAWNAPGWGNYGFGLYLTYSYDGTNYVSTPGGVINNNIESGQAFFVQSTGGAGTMTFNETSKAGSASSNFDFRGGNITGEVQRLRTNLYSVNADDSLVISDGTLNRFSDNYSNKIDGMDAKKLINSGVNLAVKTNDKLLVIESSQLPQKQDTIFFNLTGTQAQKYRFEFVAKGMSADGLDGYLEDTYLHKLTSINMEDTTKIDFTVDNNAGSKAADRFRIVFKQSVVPPVTITSLEANPEDDNVLVKWKVINEYNMQQYDVERSLDGVLFTKITSVTAANKGTSNYDWLDEGLLPGYYYYRIRSIDKNGKTVYTRNVKVLIGDGKSFIKIYPNPITDGIINLQLINQPAGRYGIRLMNNLGQVIVSKQIERMSGSSTESIKWDYNLSHGVYQLEVVKPDGSVKIIKVLY